MLNVGDKVFEARFMFNGSVVVESATILAAGPKMLRLDHSIGCSYRSRLRRDEACATTTDALRALVADAFRGEEHANKRLAEAKARHAAALTALANVEAREC